MAMKTILLITILLLGRIASSQTIYSPINYNADDVNNSNVILFEDYKWNLDADRNQLSISSSDNAEGRNLRKIWICLSSIRRVLTG
jgi:hypothetical protein